MSENQNTQPEIVQDQDQVQEQIQDQDQEHDQDTCTSKTCMECLEPHMEALVDALPSNQHVWIVFGNGQRILKDISTVFALCEGCDKKHELSSFMHDDENEDGEDGEDEENVDE